MLSDAATILVAAIWIAANQRKSNVRCSDPIEPPKAIAWIGRGELIITAMDGEPAPAQPVLDAEPVAVPDGVQDTLKKAHGYLISALSQLAFGIECISDADREAVAVETR